MEDKKLNNQPLANEAPPELSDETLDNVTGGARLPELKIPPQLPKREDITTPTSTPPPEKSRPTGSLFL